ncbi:hypothetical protein SAMN05444858_1498 [Micromonospora avicenniae]|uniref:Uncharacterized protein n=2 Tax=Micromonospora avicenniae TaxID=1198245 RepID=A0A1N7FUM9_9ACTN|nr:hypothetical protein SAMN05444858_1498 [Micromonospora avicenniae]
MVSIFSVIQLTGVVLLLSGFVRLWRILRLRRRGSRATGMVVEHVPAQGPWILFQDQQGNPQYFTPDLTSSWKRASGAPAGTQVEIVYLPEDPEKVRLLIDTLPINTNKALDDRAWRYVYFKAARLQGYTRRKEDRLRLELRDRGLHTAGTVVIRKPSIPRKSDNSERFPIAYYPRIQFKDQRGGTVTFVYQWAHMGLEPRRLPAVGEQVPVIYLPESPHVARMPGIARTLVDLALRFSVGLLLLLFIRWLD